MGPAFERVRARLRTEGRLTFAAFMAEALYGPEGYYARRPRLGGADADFFTSPELHPAFGALLGELAARVWGALGSSDRFEIVEHGPGTGALCRDLLDWADHVAPDFGRAIRYRLVEASEPLRTVQRETLAAAGPLDGRVSWKSPSPSPAPVRGRGENVTPGSPLPRTGAGLGEGDSVHGLILANELVDALPVHLVTMHDGQLRERYVVLEGDTLGWQEDAPSTPELAAYFERLGLWPADGNLAEVNLAGVAWMEQTAGTLDRGALLLLDYGYPAPELYAADRRFGTLLTYRGHTLGSDPLHAVGAQDITAHVDFTSLARAGERGGLETVGLISQAALLRRLGLDGYLQQLDRAPVSALDHDANRRALLALVEPDGLGRVQALLQTRGLPDFDAFTRERGHPFAALSACPELAEGAGSGRPDVRGQDGRAPGAWLPLLRPGQMRLPGPLEAEGFVDLEAQWQELVEGDDHQHGAG